MSVNVGDSNILPSPKVRDLGVIFAECLTLDAHISNICRRAHFHLRNIGRIRMLLSFEALSQLIHALITTTLDYCNGILFNLPKNIIERLQRIQNQAARMLKRIPRRNHTTPVLGYEPAGPNVHPPPPRMIEGGFIFFVWVSSVIKIFS